MTTRPSRATPGVYKWTWGAGAHADSFTLDIAVIPEPSTWAMMLLGFAGLGPGLNSDAKCNPRRH
jgi:hypothetical protein